MDVHLENKRSKKQLTNEQVKKLILQSQQGSKTARDMLVERNVRLVWSVVQRFLNRGYEPDDLFQIGCIGLMKAIDKFDLSYDVRFS
ncbi:MAG TPA: sigma-70 family RNA polymerase sigma factor, partial [Bacillota bacterium]|nr:sigma-70 family RNA polymerase sigma factor [Bacillota bacterium]